MKVEYIVGSFLAETEIATHIIPEFPTIWLQGGENIKYDSTLSVKFQRKTDNTTKMKIKSTDNQ